MERNRAVARPFRSRRVRTACVAAFPPAVVFLAVGTNILARNLADISYDPIADLWIFGAFTAGALLCLPVFARAPRSHPARGAARLAIAAGLAVLLFDLSGAQAGCALRLVHWLLDTLAAGEVGDGALIILQSDHGAHPTISRTLLASRPDLSRTQDALEQRPGPWRARAGARWANRFVDLASNWWSPQTAALRSGALLLVRFPGRAGFTVAPGRAQMIDVAPTIARYFGLPTDRYAGVPLQDLATSKRAATRTVVHFAGFPEPDGPAPVVGGEFWRYARRGDRWALEGRIAVTR